MGSLSDADMISMWQRMIEIYGHAWVSQYGEPTEAFRERTGEEVERLSPTVTTWREVLHGITPKELDRGIRDCIRRAEEWPPNAGQFRQRCRPPRQLCERPEFQMRALPKKSEDPEVGRQALREVYRILGRSPHGAQQ